MHLGGLRVPCFWMLILRRLYQDFLARNLKEKNATLSSQMDGIINQANGEINKLQEKLQGKAALSVMFSHANRSQRCTWSRRTSNRRITICSSDIAKKPEVSTSCRRCTIS